MQENPKYIVRQYCNLYGEARIGVGTRIGSHCDIGGEIGDRCWIQSFVFIPKGVIIEDDCFIGPGVIFTNDKYPPSKDWLTTRVKRGAVIGAGSVILPGIEIGENAVIGAGSLVVQSIPGGETWWGNPATKQKNESYRNRR